MGDGRQDARTTPPGRKLAVSEAAAELGISAEAVRSRLKRGTLQSVKEDSTVYVLLETDQTPPEHDRASDQTSDRAPSDSTALISEMRGRIEDLQTQLEAERQAHSEARTLLLRALERIPPAIEPPREAPEAPETVEEAPDRAEEPRSDAPGPQEGARRPWWRRMFGG
jgi:hypothetical protein